MRLTRRDALAALSAAGATAGCLSAPRETDDRTLATATAAAEVVFPSAVDGHRAFVETYVLGRSLDRPDYREGLRTTARDVDGAARAWYDDRFPALDPPDRDAVLREVGADAADGDPDPGATLSRRTRYYLVEEPLYALFSTPEGGRLAGVENPVGFPGGTTSYREGPE